MGAMQRSKHCASSIVVIRKLTRLEFYPGEQESDLIVLKAVGSVAYHLLGKVLVARGSVVG